MIQISQEKKIEKIVILGYLDLQAEAEMTISSSNTDKRPAGFPYDL